MIKKLAIGAGALALTAGVVVAAPASAAPKDMSKPMNDGAWCVQQGIGFLQENELLTTAAQKGLGISLGQIVKSHTNDLSAWTWCADRAS